MVSPYIKSTKSSGSSDGGEIGDYFGLTDVSYAEHSAPGRDDFSVAEHLGGHHNVDVMLVSKGEPGPRDTSSCIMAKKRNDPGFHHDCERMLHGCWTETGIWFDE